jgi:hypothetical protein
MSDELCLGEVCSPHVFIEAEREVLGKELRGNGPSATGPSVSCSFRLWSL